MEAVAVRPVPMAMSAAIATVIARPDKSIESRIRMKDPRSKEISLSFPMNVLVFLENVHPETATVRKGSVLPDNLTVAVRVQKANGPLVTTSRVLRARSTKDLSATMMLALRVTLTTTISNPVPMRTWAHKVASMPLATKAKGVANASLTPLAPALT